MQKRDGKAWRKPMKAKIKRAPVKKRPDSIGREIIESLTELAEVLESGRSDLEYFTARAVEMPDDPAVYKAANVRATRDKIGVSQSVFARLLGVSIVLVQAWEHGTRIPAPWARRLLDEINRDPHYWRGMLMDKAG
jgi:putative transcriptional regulator